MFKDQIKICRFFLINAGAYVCSYSYFIELDSFLAIRNEICIYRCKIFLAHQSICLFVPSNIDSDLSISVNFYKTCQPDQDLKYSRLLWLIDWLMYVLIHILFWDHVIWDHVKKSSTELFLNWRINRIKKIRCYIFFTIFSDRKRNMYLPILFHSLIIFSLILKNIDW